MAKKFGELYTKKAKLPPMCIYANNSTKLSHNTTQAQLAVLFYTLH